MNELNNKKLNISTAIIVVLLVVIVGLCFYIAYDKGLIFNNDNNNEEVNNNDSGITENIQYNISDLVSKGILEKVNIKNINIGYTYNYKVDDETREGEYENIYVFDLILEDNALVIKNCKDFNDKECSTNLNFGKKVKSVYADYNGIIQSIYYLVITTDGKLYKLDIANVTSDGGMLANSNKKPNELTFSIVEGFENFNVVDFYVTKVGELYVLREDGTLFNLKKVYETATVVINGEYPANSIKN